MQMSFTQRVFKVVKQIPKGKTLTYKEVAARAGSPRAYRGVGSVLKKNYDPKIPCHRVIRSDGVAGGYKKRGEKKKKHLQKKSGIKKSIKKIIKLQAKDPYVLIFELAFLARFPLYHEKQK